MCSNENGPLFVWSVGYSRVQLNQINSHKPNNNHTHYMKVFKHCTVTASDAKRFGNLQFARKCFGFMSEKPMKKGY